MIKIGIFYFVQLIFLKITFLTEIMAKNLFNGGCLRIFDS